MLFRIKSSPLQSAPIRFFSLHCPANQGGSNPLPLVSGRFRLCSALPYQILESHLQSLPWLLFAFLAGPFRIRSDPCASAGLVSNSARSGSCPSFSIAPPCLSERIDSPQRHCASSLVSAELIRCHSTQIKAGLITSAAFRVLSMRIRSRQSPGSSAPPAPISAVLDLLYAHQLSSTQIHIWTLRLFSSPCFSNSSQIRSRHRRSCSPPVRATRIHCLS